MRYKKIMMLAILLVALLTVSAVNAADNAIQDIVGVDNITDEVVSVENENQEMFKENEPGTFTDLADEIANANGHLTLTRDYISGGGFYQITIDKSIEIDGNGHTINSGIFYITASDVVLNNICFANSSSGTIYWEGSNGVLSNCRFVNSTLGQGSSSTYDELYGGAVYWHGDNNLIINCSFENTEARGSPYGRGGAIAFEGDNNRVIGCSFVNSGAYSGAGAIYLKGDNGYLSDCKFVDCDLSYLTGETNCVGGAVLWAGSGGVLSNCSFVDCSSTYNAGVIYCSGDNNLISYCSFENSAAYEAIGGAIYLIGDDCVLSDCSFVDSHSGYGGAVYWKGSNAVIANCNFTDSYVTRYYDYWLLKYRYGDGGSISLMGNNYKIYNCNFANSHTEYIHTSGGAIYLNGDNGNLSDCSFVDCYSNGYGGAIYWNGEYGNLSDCSFVDCSADGNGGAIEWASDYGDLSGSSFVNCHAFGYFDEEYEEYVGGRGGAVCWYGDEGRVAESSFKGCTADDCGGGIYFNAYDCSLIYPTFEDNYAQEGSDWYSVEDLIVIDDSKTSTVITAPDVTTTYGVSKNLVITLKDVDGNPLAGEEISFILNNEGYSSETNSKGKISIPIPTNLAPKTYVATITYEGNDEYASSTTTANVVVQKADASISAVYNANNNEVVATLTNANTGKAISSVNVEFNLDGATTTAKTNSKGQAKFSTDGLSSGTATISYAGNSKYKSASTSIGINTKSDIIISAVYDAENNELVATLTNGDTSMAVSSASVQVIMNGVVTTVKTNSKGQAKVSTAGLPLGTNTAKISYAGNSKYNSASTSIRFDVKTKVIVTDVYAYSDRIVAKLTNGATGKYIANANMIVEINGVKYDAKSDNKGQLTFDTKGLNLPSAYDLTISYRGNDRYTASSATVEVDLNKANMMITTNYHADKQKMVATLKNSKTGKVVSNANMIIELNGVKTTYKSNDQGKITLPTADFAPGTYVGTVTYPGNARYNSISAVFKVDV